MQRWRRRRRRLEAPLALWGPCLPFPPLAEVEEEPWICSSSFCAWSQAWGGSGVLRALQVPWEWRQEQEQQVPLQQVWGWKDVGGGGSSPFEGKSGGGPLLLQALPLLLS